MIVTGHDAAISAYRDIGAQLKVEAGVHAPSSFSAFLAATVVEMTARSHRLGVADRVVVDAGCGAGLVALAALQAGAAHVVAQDIDPLALAVTKANIAERAPEALERVSFLEGDWRNLGCVRADVLFANPPQRPSELLARTSPTDTHLHSGGGDDGTSGIRLLLEHARVGAVVSTFSTLIGQDPASLRAAGHRDDGEVASAMVDHDPAWGTTGAPVAAEVKAWSWVC